MDRAVLSPEGKRLFSFVVIADTHVNEDEDHSVSPFRTNAEANARARWVLHEISALDPGPDFIVHLGDIVHPTPSLPTFAEAVRRFKDLARDLRVPLHLVPGNHDVGDKRVDWMPADSVCDDYVRIYREAFGRDYFAFDHGTVRGLVVNALLLNSGLAGEAEQREWLEREFAAHAGRRLFLFTHYPPFVHVEDERSTYDNIDQPGRAWLLRLIRQYRVEAIFAGHVHNFWYDRIADTEFYLLPSTAFLRHDYSEFYRVNPGNEFGRGDVGKFGYAIVDVHERGHVMRLVRTGGRKLAPGAALPKRRTLPAQSIKTANLGNVGIEMRHPWAEVLEIPATGGVQEFGRKPARNDYPVMALWEMGASLLKVPDRDLTDSYVRSRMVLLRDVGHRFVVTALGVPRTAVTEAITAAPGLISGIEVNLSTQGLERDLGQLAAFRATTGVPLTWAKLRMHEDAHFDGGKFSHFIRTGLMPTELERHADLLARKEFRAAINGVVVRIERGSAILEIAALLDRFAAAANLAVVGAVKLADASIARDRDDDADTARVVADTLLAARAWPRVTFMFDTFMDVDRGYHPRHGFIDRMFNPRPAAHVFAALNHLLPATEPLAIDGVETRGEVRMVNVRSGRRPMILVAGAAPGGLAAIAREAGLGAAVDLSSGEILAVAELGARAAAVPLALLVSCE
ncbi:MAG: calcineurin-like phosphoesterase 5 [Alphaproteobacteria bacterium]|nr:calcineurin-like phosphoesterase 5 [Alphaproteobacteria bacterium]